MLDTSGSLLPHHTPEKPLRVIAVGFEETSTEELESLLVTLGVQVAYREVVVLRKVSPGTYLGMGKVEELKKIAEEGELGAVVVDADLSPNQLRNLEKALGRSILDRGGVILEIFSQHARTKEAKTQVELAKLQYLLPRLAHFWTHFERQRGGMQLKGMGEKQIEVDRRLVKQRISHLRKRLESIRKERDVQRSGRKDVLKVALVGYTNAGKSTLLNALTVSRVLAEDKLFATLDSSVRALDPDSHPPVVAIDTVGFIRNIPPALIASFRSTLEELHEADLLVHVVDASSPAAREQMEVTEEILRELELESKPKMVVLNKVDRLKDPGALNWARISAPGAKWVSALRSEDVISLRDSILNYFKEKMELWDVVIPYSESRLEAQLHVHGSVVNKKFLEKGIFYRLRIDGHWAKKLDLKRYRT